jgi:hypothetical protein
MRTSAADRRAPLGLFPRPAAVEAFPADLGLADLDRACPGVGRNMVRRVLRDLQKAGKVVCLERGPGAAWRKEGITPKRG